MEVLFTVLLDSFHSQSISANMKLKSLASIFLLLCVSSTAVLGQVSSCNCVAFKLSNVQDALQLQQSAIINLFHQYDIPLTLGIFASQFSVTNQLDTTIRTGLTDSKWRLELACNGFQLHNYSAVTQEDQAKDLQNCTSRIGSLFGKRPTTFLPPSGAYNDDTLAAMGSTGYTHLSASGSDSGSEGSIWRYPASASTSVVSNGGIQGVPANVTWLQVQQQLSQQGYSVVSIQPYEFAPYDASTNTYDANTVIQNQVDQLKRLLWLVRSSGKRIVLVGEINTFINIPYYPACVAFRLDDLQDYYMVKQQNDVMQIFHEYQAPISVGIIANQFGQDPSIVNTVKAYMKDPGFEINDHGWNHEDFTTYSESKQESLLSQAANKIHQVLGIRTKLFIPPYNSWNRNTITALRNQGYTMISSEVSQDPPPYNSRTNPPSNGIWRWPIGAQTATQNHNGDYVGIPASKTYNQIFSQISSYGYSAVMMHPYEFAGFTHGSPDENKVNTTQLNELRNLVEMVGLSGVKLTTLGQLQNC